MNNLKQRRKARIKRKILSSSNNKLILGVSKSNKHIYLNVFDQSQNRVIKTISTLSKDIYLGSKKNNSNISQATKLGALAGKSIQSMGERDVVFDRGGFKYHGVVKSLAVELRKYLEF